MVISRRAYRGEMDVLSIDEFMRSMLLTCRHLIDLPWRLSSPAAEAGRNACIWEDANGKMIGFAAWQVYWASLDFFVYRGPQRQAVETAIFAWATERFRELDLERGKPLPYWVEYCDDDLERGRLAEAHGFLLDEEVYVQFQHSFSGSLPAPELPDGFSLRPLAGEQEVSAYTELHRAAFARLTSLLDSVRCIVSALKGNGSARQRERKHIILFYFRPCSSAIWVSWLRTCQSSG